MLLNYMVMCAVGCFATVIADEDWTFTFDDSNAEQLEMGCSTRIVFYAHTNASWENEDLKIQVISSDESVAYPSDELFDLPRTNRQSLSTWSYSFNLTTEFLGYTKLYFQLVEMGESSQKHY